MSPTPGSYERVQFLIEAEEDLTALAERNPAVLREVLRLLVLLDAGRLTPTPLRYFGKTGDLTDCGKIVAAVEDEPEHRIVVRSVEGRFEVSEVVAIEDRSEDLPYLLAGLRLGRIDDPVRRSDAQRRVYRVRKLLKPD